MISLSDKAKPYTLASLIYHVDQEIANEDLLLFFKKN